MKLKYLFFEKIVKRDVQGQQARGLSEATKGKDPLWIAELMKPIYKLPF